MLVTIIILAADFTNQLFPMHTYIHTCVPAVLKFSRVCRSFCVLHCNSVGVASINGLKFDYTYADVKLYLNLPLAVLNHWAFSSHPFTFVMYFRFICYHYSTRIVSIVASSLLINFLRKFVFKFLNYCSRQRSLWLPRHL